ncbi:hypothetical protein [uncultured Selenomonas sp.]|uniref:hypothetical protein n=1 Tax=uncultured Selenomonas sp. TaxID=159275 RepID=UPI0028E1D04C|nr:hypothetical protein [uncultured Selenomonas sp.]
MSAISMWGVSMAAFSIVVAALLLYTVTWVPQEERKPFYILLGIFSAVYAALGVAAIFFAPNKNLLIIGSDALLSLVTLYLIRFARIGEGRRKKLLLCGVFLSMILLLAACSDRVIIITLEQLPFDVTDMKEVQETAVTVLSVFMMAHVAGLLELCLFEKAAHSDKTQS